LSGAREIEDPSLAEVYFVDETDLALAIVVERKRREEALRKRRWRRQLTAVWVGVAHAVVIFLMIHAKMVELGREKPPTETQLLWLLLPRATMTQAPDRDWTSEDMVRQAYKAVQMLPRVAAPRPNAITINPGEALGQAIACGAGSFEYLTPEGQERCQHKPWALKYDRYGYVILDSEPRHEKEKREKPRPSDVMAHQRNTAPTDTKNVDINAPCLDCIIRGN
jgi:hypothetical protein